MILDVYPSSKDAEMVDLLYEFERDTRLSLNILVENYLEKLLYDKGYLGGENEKETETQNTIKKNLPVKKENFTVKSNGKKYGKVLLGNLDFGNCKHDVVDERIEKLCLFSYEELEELSRNNWDKSYGQYSSFLKWKIDNPMTPSTEYFSKSRFELSFRHQGSWQIRHKQNGFSICSGKDKEEFELIKNHLYTLTDEELNQLEEKLSKTKRRRQFILNEIGE